MTYRPESDYFSGSLAETDPELSALLQAETDRQAHGVEARDPNRLERVVRRKVLVG